MELATSPGKMFTKSFTFHLLLTSSASSIGVSDRGSPLAPNIYKNGQFSEQKNTPPSPVLGDIRTAQHITLTGESDPAMILNNRTYWSSLLKTFDYEVYIQKKFLSHITLVFVIAAMPCGRLRDWAELP